MNFFKNICGTLGTKIVYLVCGLVSGMVTARWLGPHDRGVLAIFTAIPSTIWMLSSFGINQANTYYIGKKKYPIPSVVSNSFIVPFIIGIIASVAIWLSKDIFILKYLKAINSFYLSLALITVPILLLINSSVGIFRGIEKFFLLNVFQIGRTISGLLLAVFVLIILGKGLTALVIGLVILEATNLAWRFYEVNKLFKINLTFNINLAKDVFFFGAKSYIQNMIGYLHNKIDLYMIAYFLIPSQIAFYDISVIIGEILLFLPQTIAFVILPKFVKADEKEKIHVATQTVRFAFALSLVFCLFLFLTGKWLIVTVYGKEYIDAYIPLCFLLPGLLFSCLNSVIVPYYTSRHRQKVTIFVSLVSLTSNVIINLILIPKYGIKGAAISTSITYSLFSLILLFIFKYENNISFIKIFFIQKSDLLLLKTYLKQNSS